MPSKRLILGGYLTKWFSEFRKNFQVRFFFTCETEQEAFVINFGYHEGNLLLSFQNLRLEKKILTLKVSFGTEKLLLSNMVGRIFNSRCFNKSRKWGKVRFFFILTNETQEAALVIIF